MSGGLPSESSATHASGVDHAETAQLAGILDLARGWNGSNAKFIGESVLDALMRSMELDFAYLRLDSAVPALVRLSETLAKETAQGGSVASKLAAIGALERPSQVDQLTINGIALSLVQVPLGVVSSMGRLIAGSRRDTFPSQSERQCLSIAAMQAALAFRELDVRDGPSRQAETIADEHGSTESERAPNIDIDIDIDDRKRAQNALSTSEAKLSVGERNLRLIIDSLPVLAFIARADGSADFINQQYSNYVGLPAEKLVDWGYVNAWHPDDVAPMMSRWLNELDATAVTNRGRFRRHDGEYRECYLQAQKITDAFGTVRWLGVALDIEDMQRAQRALRESEAQLQESERQLNLIINTMPAMAWSTTPDGMLDFCNQHFLDFAGLPSEEIMGTGFYRIFHPDDVSRMSSTWQEIMAAKRGREVESRIRGADGQYRWFSLRQNPLLDADGEIVKWYGVIVDIEDRKRAEDALRLSEAALSASEHNLRLRLDSLPVLAWSARPDGRADFVNQRWVDYAGASAEQILEWGFLDFYHPDDVEGMMETWTRNVAISDHSSLKGRIRRADGEYRTFLFEGRKLTDANGVVRWVGANVDIEDLTRAEDKLRQSQTDLAHITRMTTMGELTVSIAHEVNQPLMAIVMNAGTCLRWLDEGHLDIALARKAAERIVKDGHRAGDIIASIRALARKMPLRMVPMDMKDAIEEVRELLKGELQRCGVEFEIEFQEAPFSVLGDRTQLQQVILNLVMNGVEAMANSAPESRRLVIQVLAEGDGFAQVRVADLGAGLDAGNSDRMFDAFFSTKRGGIGMGLSICRSIVEAHGGRIWAADNDPRGSVFCFTVRLAPGDKTE